MSFPILSPQSRAPLFLICLAYLFCSGLFATSNLDIDEFTFIREPYELLGGDYTRKLVQQGDVRQAATTAAKAYYFYWKYRPLFSPIIDPADRELFRAEEDRFGYVQPGAVAAGSDNAEAAYKQRLVVPEPNRFYSHGAGKPLLSAVLSIPQLALLNVIAGQSLLNYQFAYNYHPLFILTRLVQIFAGLATILITYHIARRAFDEPRALVAAALVALFPTSIKFFPNIHHDSLLPPFLLLFVWYATQSRYIAAGLWFGLALAVKNTAIFVMAGMAALVAWDFLRSVVAREPLHDAATVFLPRARGLVLATVMSVATLLPFANPASYLAEIATPLTHRATDTRGENVESFSVSSQLSSTPEPGRSAQRPGVTLARKVLRMESTDFFLWAVALLVLATQAIRAPIARASIAIMLIVTPYGIVFGYDVLMYRALPFVPFFALLATSIAKPRHAWVLVGLLCVLNVLLLIDPVTTDRIHMPANNLTLIGQAFGLGKR